MKPKLPSRKALVKKLDRVFSEIVRARDRRANDGLCVFGCGREIECAFHFVTRAKYSVRWDFDNAVGSCGGCNFENEFNPHPYIRWFLRTRGQEAYENLLSRSQQLARRTRTDMMEMLSAMEKTKSEQEA